MLWLLCGQLLDFQIVKNDNKKMYTMVGPTGKQRLVHATAINSLISRKLMKIDQSSRVFRLTDDGTSVARSRLNRSKIIKADPSNYIG